MEIKKIQNGADLTIEIIGRLDTTTYEQLEAELNLEGVKNLVFDLKGLEYISSAGLRVVLATYKKMIPVGTFALTNVNETVKEVFDITGFSQLLTIK